MYFNTQNEKLIPVPIAVFFILFEIIVIVAYFKLLKLYYIILFIVHVGALIIFIFKYDLKCFDNNCQ